MALGCFNFVCALLRNHCISDCQWPGYDSDVKVSDKNVHLLPSHPHPLTAWAISIRPDPVIDIRDDSVLQCAFNTEPLSLSHQHVQCPDLCLRPVYPSSPHTVPCEAICLCFNVYSKLNYLKYSVLSTTYPQPPSPLHPRLDHRKNSDWVVPFPKRIVLHIVLKVDKNIVTPLKVACRCECEYDCLSVLIDWWPVQGVPVALGQAPAALRRISGIDTVMDGWYCNWSCLKHQIKVISYLNQTFDRLVLTPLWKICLFC